MKYTKLASTIWLFFLFTLAKKTLLGNKWSLSIKVECCTNMATIVTKCHSSSLAWLHNNLILKRRRKIILKQQKMTHIFSWIQYTLFSIFVMKANIYFSYFWNNLRKLTDFVYNAKFLQSNLYICIVVFYDFFWCFTSRFHKNGPKTPTKSRNY